MSQSTVRPYSPGQLYVYISSVYYDVEGRASRAAQYDIPPHEAAAMAYLSAEFNREVVHPISEGFLKDPKMDPELAAYIMAGNKHARALTTAILGYSLERRSRYLSDGRPELDNGKPGDEVFDTRTFIQGIWDVLSAQETTYKDLAIALPGIIEASISPAFTPSPSLGY